MVRNIKYLTFVAVLVLLFANTSNAGKLINSEQWPQTPDLTWEIINSNLKVISGHLEDETHRSAITSARNVVTAIRALQNFARLEKYRDSLKKVDLKKALTLASRMANALIKNKTKVANTTLEKLKNVLKK